MSRQVPLVKLVRAAIEYLQIKQIQLTKNDFYGGSDKNRHLMQVQNKTIQILFFNILDQPSWARSDKGNFNRICMRRSF